MTLKNTSRSKKRTLSDDVVYAHEYLAELQDLTLAAQIRVLREQRGWSQQELADHAGMAQARVSLLESVDYSGRTLSTLRKLAAAFDVGLSVSFVPYFREIWRLEHGSPTMLRVPSREDENNFGIPTTSKSELPLPATPMITQSPVDVANTAGTMAHNVLPTNAMTG